MSEESRQDLLAKMDPDRREFLRKIAIAAAFAAPTVATFSLDGMRKKAFAQAYDRPRVLSVQDTGEGYRAVVTFSQAMNMIDMSMFGAPDVRAANGVSPPCCSFTVTPSEASIKGVTWSGNMHQVINFCTDANEQLTVTYNWDCGSAVKFTGVNGLELEPFSGTVPVSGNCG